MPTENRSNDADGWIACDDGLHLIQMDKNLSHYGWVFRKVDGGLPYSVREATSYEMAHAQARQHLRIGVAQIAGQAPAPQPHPEPIAWMVGTAFWWTKEEAERDAAETGLPIVGLGPMTGIAPAEQHQGEPAAIVAIGANDTAVIEFLSHDLKVGTELYTRVDPGEVERLVAANTEYARRHLEQVAELAQCESMAAMIAEREWAEHVGTGPVSSKVEAAFTQLHNDLHEAGEKLAERDALLHKLKETLQREYWDEYAGLDETRELIDAALSASQEPSTPAASYPDRLCHIDYTAHPYRCGCLRGDEESQRIYDEHCRKASAEPSESVTAEDKP